MTAPALSSPPTARSVPKAEALRYLVDALNQVPDEITADPAVEGNLLGGFVRAALAIVVDGPQVYDSRVYDEALDAFRELCQAERDLTDFGRDRAGFVGGRLGRPLSDADRVESGLFEQIDHWTDRLIGLGR